MRVTIDATSLLVRSAGVKSYTWHWLRALRAASDEIRAFPFVDDPGGLNHERSAFSKPATLARLAVVHAVNTFGSAALDRAIGDTDIFHAGNLVRRAPTRSRLTATIHDLTAWIMPQHHTQAIAQGDQLFAERVLKRADGLIAVSENTRQDAIRILGIAPERIRTIYSGIADEYFNATPERRAKPYVLYVGTIEPRKNLPALLDAWRGLKPNLRKEFDLVVAGPEGWHSADTMARVRAEAVYLGYVQEAKMPGLFAGATVFVYPSLYEGFGFPVVQAMAAGVPVITSNTSCLPEIAGGAAMLVDPASANEIAGAITALLESKSERAGRAALGRVRAEHFSWSRCASESLSFFRGVTAGAQPPALS
jgi:glycosyltransferase involved in cell wall biosynthesis